MAPDIAVPAEDALKVAQLDALKKIAKEKNPVELTEEIRKAIARARIEVTP